MKKTLFTLSIVLGVLFAQVSHAQLSVFRVSQGGTGTSTPSGILYGDNGSTGHLNTVGIGTGLTFTGGTLSASGGSGFPFTVGTNYGQVVYSTSTPTLWFQSGLFASSTSYFTNLIAGNTATSTIGNFAGVLDATTFAGSDIGAKVNAAYAALPTTGGTIFIPAGIYSFSTEMSFGVNNKHVTLQCDPGGATQMTWTPVTGTSTLINTGQNTLGQMSSINDCIYIGSGTTTNNVAIELGGPNGARGFSLNHVEIENFGNAGAVQTGNNTYLLTFFNDEVHRNGKAFYDMSQNNAGEAVNFINGMWGDCHSATPCTDIGGGADTVVFNGTSFDDGQVNIGPSTRTVIFIGNNVESSNGDSSPTYVPIVIQSSSATHVIFDGVTFLQGANANCPAQSVQNGAYLTVESAVVDQYGGCKVTDFITNTGNGWTKVLAINNKNTAYTTIWNSTGGTGQLQSVMEDNGFLGLGGIPTLGQFMLEQTADNNANGLTITNHAVSATTRFWEDTAQNTRLDGDSTANKDISINALGTGTVGIGLIPVANGSTYGDTLQIQNSLMVGSSSVNGFIEQRNTGGTAWTSKFSTSNNLLFGDNAAGAVSYNIANTANGSQINVGLGSSTPFAKLSISANVADTNTMLFAIGSTTGGTATTTLFQVNNAGTTTLTGDLLFTSSGTVIHNIGGGNGNDKINLLNVNNFTFNNGTSIKQNDPTNFAMGFYIGNPTTELLTLNPNGAVGIGTTTPLATLQVTATSTNATTSIQFGKPLQNKGTCITYYDDGGTPVYGHIAIGATAFTYTSTKPSGCQN